MTDESRNNEILDLLPGYFSGQLSADDSARIETWIGLSADNRKLFEEYRKLWDSAGKPIGLKDIDIEKEWEVLSSKTVEREARVVKIHHTAGRSTSLWLKVAASILLVAVTGYAVLTAYFARNSVTVNSGLAVKTVDLPDGSQVTLNRNSSITYSNEFGIRKRDVALSGEAFFEVTHDPQKIFTVKTRLAEIVVTGTAFNVRARKDTGNVEVLVSNGTVEMLSGHKQKGKIILHKGDLGIAYGNNGSLVRKDSADLNELAWKTGLFTFNNDSLGYVVSMLNRTYKSRVEFRNKSLMKCRITVSFDNDSLEDILEVIKSTLGLSVIKENDTYYFEGSGC